MTNTGVQTVAASGIFEIGGDLPVHRLGYGAMRITGEGIWGEPADRDEALRVLRRCPELGVNFIDTADSYGPEVSERLIGEALAPYRAGTVVATKAGFVRTGPRRWHPLGRPEYLRQQCELSLRRLRVDAIALFQLHRVDPAVPAEEQYGLLAELRAEGKVRHVGLSEVDVDQIEAARAIVPIATVQNRYNMLHRAHEAVLEHCTREGIGFIPWHPVAVGELARVGGPLEDMAREHGATPAQLALAWLLRRSPVMLPIPGTSSVAHLEENCAAAQVVLSDADEARLTALGTA